MHARSWAVHLCAAASDGIARMPIPTPQSFLQACEEKLSLSSQVVGLQEQLAEVQLAADALGADAQAKRAVAALEADRAEQLAAKVRKG